jgi:threonylcarbamoyladenosine tRNA methylthiotransferase MtaB
MREVLVKKGYKECLSKDIAEIYILNTCTVTHEADKESRHWVGLFHRTNPLARIIVTGCFAENDADQISFLPGVSRIIKNSEKHRIAEYLDGNQVASDGTDTAGLTIAGFQGHTKVFVKIQDGCENRCAYCKVPLVRTVLKSKPIKNIVEECTALVKNGFKEIILTGICLGAWGKDFFPGEMASLAGLSGLTLLDALKAINGIEGDFRIRLSSVEPRYVTDELIEFIAKTPRICRHLHIPFQSGDDEVLRRMNRSYTAAEYKRIVSAVRSGIKDAAITTDILVGFPGESEECFRNTVNFIKEIVPSRTHLFTFSKRGGTAAQAMTDEIDAETARRRYLTLKTVTMMSSCIYRSLFLGRKLDVLVEAKRDRHSGLLTGYSGNYIKMFFEGPDELMKNVVPVKITGITMMCTLGEFDGR